MSNSKNNHLNNDKRPERTPLHSQKVLTTTHREGYVRRWVNESIDKLQAYKNAGWSPVVGEDNRTDDTRVQSESQLGSIVRKVVNKDPSAAYRTAILMEIKQEYYDNDQAAKQKRNDNIMSQIHNTAANVGDYGQFKMDKNNN